MSDSHNLYLYSPVKYYMSLFQSTNCYHLVKMDIQVTVQNDH